MWLACDVAHSIQVNWYNKSELKIQYYLNVTPCRWIRLTWCDIPLDWHGVTSHYTWHGVTSHYTWLSISTAVWTPNIVKFEKSLCARHRCMWSGGINPRFLNRAVDGGEWSTVHPGRLSSRKSLHITLSLRSLIAYRANLNSLKKKNLFYGCQKSNHGSPVVKPLP